MTSYNEKYNPGNSDNHKSPKGEGDEGCADGKDEKFKRRKVIHKKTLVWIRYSLRLNRTHTRALKLFE